MSDGGSSGALVARAVQLWLERCDCGSSGAMVAQETASTTRAMTQVFTLTLRSMCQFVTACDVTACDVTACDVTACDVTACDVTACDTKQKTVLFTWVSEGQSLIPITWFPSTPM
jgi:hypothetical protein